jgi:hypothetical protein
MKILYRKRKKTQVWDWLGSSWNFNIEEGDLLIDSKSGTLFRAVPSSGWGKRMAGELTPKRVKPPRPGLRVVREGKEEESRVYWTDETPWARSGRNSTT